MPILYGLVFKPFLDRVAISSFISVLYGLVFQPFLGRVTIWSSISILYGLAFKPFLGKVTVFISICIYYSHISLSLFERTSLSLAYLLKIYTMTICEYDAKNHSIHNNY